jgi:hypothetical protein
MNVFTALRDYYNQKLRAPEFKLGTSQSEEHPDQSFDTNVAVHCIRHT